MANQKHERHRALTLTRIIYEECAKAEAPFRTVPFEEARKLGLSGYENARRAAERIIATSPASSGS